VSETIAVPRDRPPAARQAAAIRAAADRSDPIDRLGRLFDAHHDALYRLARRMASDAEEARDLVQEAFLRAARSAGALPPEDDAARAWLFRVVVNLCRDRRRRLDVRRRAAETVLRPAPTAEATGGGPESRALARDAVSTALAELPPKRRAVVVLHELEERTVAEIARLLGVTRVTVRWHLMAGRKQLAALLSPGGMS
jgi:RNA polymerase sigma-70 factor, ECF subfamily